MDVLKDDLQHTLKIEHVFRLTNIMPAPIGSCLHPDYTEHHAQMTIWLALA